LHDNGFGIYKFSNYRTAREKERLSIGIAFVWKKNWQAKPVDLALYIALFTPIQDR